jgi:hypothetical protein
MGPFRPNGDGGVRLNPTAWNKVANMLFVESPGMAVTEKIITIVIVLIITIDITITIIITISYVLG